MSLEERVMILSNYLKKTLIVIPTVIIAQSLLFISQKMPDLLVSEKFIGLIMGSITHPDVKLFVFSLENLIYIFLFEILFGHYVYNELRYSSTYVFSRISNTSRWFLKKTLNLWLYSAIYILFYLFTMLLLAIYSTGNSPDKDLLIIFIQLFIKLTTICFTGTLLINILSFYNGTVIAFLVVYAVQVFEVFLIMNMESIAFLKRYTGMIRFLPINNLIINNYQYASLNTIDILHSFTLILLTLLFSLMLVKRMDLSLVKHN